MKEFKRYEVDAEMGYDTLKEFLRGNYEIINQTKNIPYSKWEQTAKVKIVLETDEDEEVQ